MVDVTEVLPIKYLWINFHIFIDWEIKSFFHSKHVRMGTKLGKLSENITCQDNEYLF